MGKSATKWQFNLHLQDKECWKQEILIWKNGRREAIVVDVVLDLSDLEDEVDLVVDSSVKEKKMVTIPKSSSVYAAKAVVLESWTIRMGPEESVFLEEFPSLYKKASAFIRTVYFTTRILPLYRTFRKFRKLGTIGLSLVHRISESSAGSAVVPLSESLLQEGIYETISKRNLGSLSTPHGYYSV
jgi:hypothetical protein